MTTYFDKIFQDFDKIMKRLQGFDTIGHELESGKLKGGWDVKKIDEPNIKGYVIRGQFWSDQPVKPYDPFAPKDPFQRRPTPQRSFKSRVSRKAVSCPASTTTRPSGFSASDASLAR